MITIICIVFTFALSINGIFGESTQTEKEAQFQLRENVRFFLYTRDKRDDPQQLYVNNKKSIETSDYNVHLPTKFYTHGFNKSYLDDDSSLVRKGFLTAVNCNMIVVDWGKIAETLPYEELVSYTKPIGSYIAEMIDFLVSLGSKASDMSLVGHSLGAHYIGSAGYLATNKVRHVVGLDPAKSGLNTENPELRISKESAEIVEIIHTNNNSTAYGHLDFYPNGGQIQPGCDDTVYHCDHRRAYIYYAEAMTIAKNWLAIQCDNYDAFLREDYNNSPIMSFPLHIGLTTKTPGTYYLRTNASAPYGLGFPGLRPKV